jgi:hypothetical protein
MFFIRRPSIGVSVLSPFVGGSEIMSDSPCRVPPPQHTSVGLPYLAGVRFQNCNS